MNSRQEEREGRERRFTVGLWIEGGVEMEVEARDPREALEQARKRFSMDKALKALDVVDVQVMEKST